MAGAGGDVDRSWKTLFKKFYSIFTTGSLADDGDKNPHHRPLSLTASKISGDRVFSHGGDEVIVVVCGAMVGVSQTL